MRIIQIVLFFICLSLFSLIEFKHSIEFIYYETSGKLPLSNRQIFIPNNETAHVRKETSYSDTNILSNSTDNYYQYDNNSNVLKHQSINRQNYYGSNDTTSTSDCAILFWGLPRAFDTLVLPSVIQNIILPNLNYRCDYYVHYYSINSEEAGRSGNGGFINWTAIYTLQDVVQKYHSDDLLVTSNNNAHDNKQHQQHQPIIRFTSDSDEDFLKIYSPLLEKIRTTKDPGGKKYYYYPWKSRSSTYPTSAYNVIKMWHSIESVWNLMESTTDNGLGSNTSHPSPYKQVGMFRSDVFYAAPIDIYYDPSTHLTGKRDTSIAVLPNFGKHPVSDRLIYGSYVAVRMWATQRFNHLEQHVQYIYENDRGWGLHSERFIFYTIFPLIKEYNITIINDPTMCFLRARSDQSIWIRDCKRKSMGLFNRSYDNLRERIEEILQRKCGTYILSGQHGQSLLCSGEPSS